MGGLRWACMAALCQHHWGRRLVEIALRQEQNPEFGSPSDETGKTLGGDFREMRHVLAQPYECFHSTTSKKSAGWVKHSRLVVRLPQPDRLFSAVASCQQVPYPKPARSVCLVAVFSHPCSCSAYLRVGGVVFQQDSWSQDRLDAFHADSDVPPVRNHTCGSASNSCDGDCICSVTRAVFLSSRVKLGIRSFSPPLRYLRFLL